jgi:3-isopropylmalate dehydratase small subunit
VILSGTAVLVPGDDVDTDVLYPGPFLNVQEPRQMAEHLFEGLDPALRDQLVGDTVLVVGENFGVGSSREHVPLAMRESGVRCIVGRSFARIFFRNCINLGMPVVVSPQAVDAARPGDPIEIDTDAGVVEVTGRALPAVRLPGFVQEMVRDGGLVPWIRAGRRKEAT